jgi:hypothetical protein
VQPGAEFAVAPAKVVVHLPKGLRSVEPMADFQKMLALVTEGGNVNLSVTLVQNWSAALGKQDK